MKKFIFLMATIFIIAGIILLLNSTPKKNLAIIATIGPEPVSIDPQLAATIDCRVYIRHMFEGLTRLDVNGNVVPGMAIDWKIDDTETVYTFNLREAKWSDGQEVTAHDFEFAWKRLLNPETASEAAYKLYFVKNAEKFNRGECGESEVGVKAIDEKTLQVNLEKPTSYFIDMLSYENFMPVRKDAVDNDGKWTQNTDTLVCNGAFKLKEWIHGSKIVLERNENYWDNINIKSNEIEFLLIDDYVAGLNAFEAGELDINDSAYPPEEVSRLIENGSMKISEYLATYYYNFNTAKKPFNDARVRRAICLAIDREYIVEKVTKAGETPATAYIPKGITVNNANYRDITNFDLLNKTARIDEAKKLLAEAGYPNGDNFPTIEIVFNTSEEHRKIAEVIQNDLKGNLGIDVTLRNVEWSTLQQILSSGDYDIARNGQPADYNDPITFLDGWITNGSLNFSSWSSKKYDNLIKTASTTTNDDLRVKSMQEAEEIILEEAPICPIYWYVQKVLISNRLQDAYINPLGGYNLHYAYIKE